MKEKEISVALGISRETIRDMRPEFTEGTDWVIIPNRRPKHLWEVKWTEEGVAALKAKIGFKEPEQIKPPEKKRGTVYAKFKNPKIIGMQIDGASVNVVCKDSSKFHIGMPADVRWDGSRWCVVKHPRFNGKY